MFTVKSLENKSEHESKVPSMPTISGLCGLQQDIFSSIQQKYGGVIYEDVVAAMSELKFGAVFSQRVHVMSV